MTKKVFKINFTAFLLLLLCLCLTSSVRTPLQTLGFGQQKPTKDQIKQRFKQLSMKYHPDRNNDPSSMDRYQKIIEAYETLKSNNFEEIEEPKWKKNTSYEEKSKYRKRNMEDFFHKMEWDLIFTHGQQNTESINETNFLVWCESNPSVLVGAILISFGFLNLIGCF